MRTFAKCISTLALMFALLSPGYASDEQFSMQIQGKPLADVFQDLIQMSGSTIEFDKEWANQLISVRFVNLTLEKAITKILTNLNHVVIFEQDSIRIKIYGAVTPDKSMNQMPATDQYPNRTPADSRIRPSASPFPIASRQGNDTDESIMEETAEVQESDQEEKAAEPEESEQEDVENTDKKEGAGEQEEADEAEGAPSANDKEAGSNDESGSE